MGWMDDSHHHGGALVSTPTSPRLGAIASRIFVALSLTGHVAPSSIKQKMSR